MALNRKTKEKLKKTIQAFKLEDFFTYVLQAFKQVSLEEISEVVKRNRLHITKSEVTNVFLKLLMSKDLVKEDCERSIVLLQIQAVALRPECRLWTALRLRGEPDLYGFSADIVENLVSRALRRNGIESITRAVTMSSAIWINITVKKITQRKGIVHESPIFCAFYTDHPFLFISKNKSASVERSIAEAFGFVDYSHCKLTDRNPSSMLKILTSKETRLEVVQSFKLENEPLETTNGLDFSQYLKRQKYMDYLFPSDTPKLSDYTVECREAPWPVKSEFPEMGDRSYPISLHLRTRDTIGMFRALAEEGILEVPVPSYVRRAINCARNKIRVRANRNVSMLDQSCGG